MLFFPVWLLSVLAFQIHSCGGTPVAPPFLLLSSVPLNEYIFMCCA